MYGDKRRSFDAHLATFLWLRQLKLALKFPTFVAMLLFLMVCKSPGMRLIFF